MILSGFRMRPAGQMDVPAITRIYNQAVLTTNATMDTHPQTEAERDRWMAQHGDRLPVLVVEGEKEGVVGWASLSRWSDRPGYDRTCESSVYIDEKWRGKGFGHALMREMVLESERQGFHVVLARIAADNASSIRLHEAVGFERVGVTREVGFKFGIVHDVLVMQRIPKFEG